MTSEESDEEFFKKDLEEQKAEMDSFKWIESEKAGHDVGKAVYLVWVEKFAAIWRAYHPFPKNRI
jgi:hypothetical protein